MVTSGCERQGAGYGGEYDGECECQRAEARKRNSCATRALTIIHHDVVEVLLGAVHTGAAVVLGEEGVERVLSLAVLEYVGTLDVALASDSTFGRSKVGHVRQAIAHGDALHPLWCDGALNVHVKLGLWKLVQEAGQVL